MLRYLKERYGVTTQVFVLALVSLFNDVSSEMLYPVVPVFLTTVLHAPVAVVGLIEGIAESVASLFKGIMGKWSDRTGKRKVFVVIGYGLGAISNLFYGFARTWHAVLGGKVTSRFGKGVRTSARDAIIAEDVDPAMRGRAFGFHRAADTMGAILGPLLALLLLWAFKNNYRLVFFTALIPTSIAVVLLLVFIREKARAQVHPSAESRLRLRALPRAFIGFLVVSTIFALGNSTDAFLILKSTHLGFSVMLTVLLYVLYNTTYSLFSPPAGDFADKLGPSKVFAVGMLLFAAVYACFGLANLGWELWVLFPIYGCYMALTDGVGKAYIASIVGGDQLGTAYGYYYMATGVMTFFASLVGGLLWTYVAPAATFYFGAVLAIVALVGFLVVG